mmetsp:Transcript_16132/g.34912  ORF Transcript_16132/g.34912 Transcript_16132/m.34912 type:complete len:460 (-) Transcript_16132:866-2245(-)
MLPLRCSAQNYEWGRPAASSEVAKLAQANGNTIDESKTFAELWMGTHPNCPALVASTSGTLQQWIEEHPESLGLTVQKRFGVQLPFLFKVLSVNKALSIQSHPDKQLAERLHKEYPKMYPDDNHKPEMALALTDFEALCGFARQEEVAEALRGVPELAQCVGEEATAALLRARGPDKQALKTAFTALMTADPDKVAAAVDSLVGRLGAAHEGDTNGGAAHGNDKAHVNGGAGSQQQHHAGGLAAKEALALRLNSQYPRDVGVLSCFFLNLVSLRAGQAIYLAANEPHAYLSGELMECMAASDNVIRAGLTPKFKHTQVLCESLTYEQGLPEVLEGSPSEVQGAVVYRPPFEEFEIRKATVPAGSSLQLPVSPGPMILLVQHGAGSVQAEAGVSGTGLQREVQVGRGSIAFVPAATQLLVSAQGEDLTLWAAAVNSTFFQLHDALGAAAQQHVPAATVAA